RAPRARSGATAAPHASVACSGSFRSTAARRSARGASVRAWPPLARLSSGPAAIAPPGRPESSPACYLPADLQRPIATSRGEVGCWPRRQASAGEISLDIDAEPLAKVEQVWPQAGSALRVAFVP